MLIHVSKVFDFIRINSSFNSAVERFEEKDKF